MLGNLALAAMKLERDGEAIDALHEVSSLKAGPSSTRKSEPRWSATSRRSPPVSSGSRSKPRPRARSSSTNARRCTNSRSRTRTDAADGRFSLGVRAGHHRFTARLAGYQDATWEVDARPGATLSHRLELVPVTSASPATEGPTTSPAASSSWNTQKAGRTAVSGRRRRGGCRRRHGLLLQLQVEERRCERRSARAEAIARLARRTVTRYRSTTRAPRGRSPTGWGWGRPRWRAAAALYSRLCRRPRHRPPRLCARTLNFVPAVAPASSGRSEALRILPSDESTSCDAIRLGSGTLVPAVALRELRRLSLLDERTIADAEESGGSGG